MSKVGKRPIPIPEGVTVNIEGRRITVKGSRGELSQVIPPDIMVSVEDKAVVVRRPSDQRLHRAYHGLTRTLIANMVVGVSRGFEKGIEVVGVGYRVQQAAGKLVFQLGLSHPVEFAPPPGISFGVEGPTRLKVMGADKALVGQVAAQIRELRPPDSYKGKGLKYVTEVLRLKPGKAGKGVKAK